MGLLISTDLENFIYEILTTNVSLQFDVLAKTIAHSLLNTGWLKDNISKQEFLEMTQLINAEIKKPSRPTTAERNLWSKARRIYQMLINDKYRKGGFVNSVGKIHTTRG